MSSLYINVTDRRPIWEQLTTQVKELVLCGAMAPGEQLPSVRTLAGELAINPNTIQKAYAELERCGVAYSVAGRGCFISQDPTGLFRENRERIGDEARKLFSSGRDMGMDKGAFIRLLDDVYGEEKT